MRNKMSARLIMALLITVNGTAFGREWSVPFPRQAPTEIEQLKQDIERLEAADKDPTLSASVKQMNSRYLQQKRSEFETKLNNEISSFRKYLEMAGASLTQEQKQEVEGKIAALEQYLKNIRANQSDLALAGNPPPSEQRPEVALRRTAPEVTPKPRRPAPDVAPNPRKPAPEVTPNTAPQLSKAADVAPTPQPLTPVASSMAPAGNQTLKDCSAVNQHPESSSLYEKYLCQVISKIQTRKAKGDTETFPGGQVITLPADPKATLTGADDFQVALALIAKRDKPTYLVIAEEARTDKQIGAGPEASGTTSLVVKGSAPTFLGMAVENGALDRTISGSTITFRGNPVGILQALANKGYLQSFEESENNSFLRILKPLSFSFSFDTSRGNEQTNTSPGTMPPAMPNVFTADLQQLSGVTARYEFYNQRDPRNKKYRKDWVAFLDGAAQKLTDVVSDTFQVMLKDATLKDWYDQASGAIMNASAENVESVVKAQFANLPVDKLSPVTVEKLEALEQGFEGYLTERKNLLDKIAKGGIVTFEYTNTRNVTSPNLSNFRLIAEKGATGKVDATFNGSLTIFDKIPTGMSRRIRDFQFSGQADYRAGNFLGSGNAIFFVSGKYERQMENALDPAGMTVMNTKGDIFVAQTGVKIPIKGTGFRIPISFSVANRTELIKEREVRGNIGFTFDLDTLFSNVKP
jgi:hypothetical protein